MRGWLSRSLSSQSNTGRGWRRSVRRLEAGRYLFAHSDPANRIFVWGQRPDIYLDAHRRPACRYITTFPLTGYVFGGPIPGFDTRSRILPGAWTILEQDFARHPPTYIVDVQPDPKSAYYPVKDFPILAKLLAERYSRWCTLPKGLFIGPMFAHSFRQFRFAVLGIVLLTVATGLPAILHPLPIYDEAGYSVIANEIVDGGRP